MVIHDEKLKISPLQPVKRRNCCGIQEDAKRFKMVGLVRPFQSGELSRPIRPFQPVDLVGPVTPVGLVGLVSLEIIGGSYTSPGSDS